MTEAAVAPADNGFLARFITLSVLAGTTIGMGNVITTLFALHLNATPFQVGLISGSATLGMMLVTLPAGFLIAKYGAKRVYLLASLNCMAIYLIVPFLGASSALAVARGLVGASVPFRTISMNSTFLQRLKSLGQDKAGWFRASQSTGMAVLGPWLGTALTGSANFLVSYICLAALFGAMALWSQNFLPEAEAVAETSAGPGLLEQLRLMLKDLWVGESCLTEFVNSSVTSLFSSFILVLAITGLHLPKAMAVALVTTQGLATIAALFVLGPLLRKVRLVWAYAASLGFATAALLLVGFGKAWLVLMLGAVCLAVAAATIHLVNMQRLAHSPIAKSKISSLLNLSGQTGSLLGSVVGGGLSLAIGLQNIFLAWIPIVWVAAAFCFWRHRQAAQAELKS
jgi:MFS family permease